ncbi:hypothetical protein SLS53_008134 [Cytospora paraplurivora]|uniref:Uncharacterized protein n=1 Tax=Cytospora paraplurivora TaxID=2898453 RepID=A0AAN9TYW0_9PEZI
MKPKQTRLARCALQAGPTCTFQLILFLRRRHLTAVLVDPVVPVRPSLDSDGTEDVFIAGFGQAAEQDRHVDKARRMAVFMMQCTAILTAPQRLDPDVSLPELLQSIARTAPVGAIASAFLLPNQQKRASKGAKVNFNQRRAAMELVRLSREKTFLVRDRTPFVAEHRKELAARGALQSIPPSLSECSQTRVLVVQGPAEVEGFYEPSIRQLLVADEAAMRDSGPFGVQSEAVITTDSPDGTRRSIEWRFVSYSAQALPFKKVIKRHFGKQLRVTHGRDPCCAEDIYDAARRALKAQGGPASDTTTGQQDTGANVDKAKRYEDGGDDSHADLVEKVDEETSAEPR